MTDLPPLLDLSSLPAQLPERAEHLEGTAALNFGHSFEFDTLRVSHRFFPIRSVAVSDAVGKGLRRGVHAEEEEEGHRSPSSGACRGLSGVVLSELHEGRLVLLPSSELVTESARACI